MGRPQGGLCFKLPMSGSAWVVYTSRAHISKQGYRPGQSVNLFLKTPGGWEIDDSIQRLGVAWLRMRDRCR